MDEQVARREAPLGTILDQFVCVRMIQANGMDLSLFQFDYDLTWAVFFLHADRTIYGRYGTRSDEGGSKDVSLEGFRQAALGVLELHRGYPANKAAFAGKQGPPPQFAAPEDSPLFSARYQAKLKPGSNPRQTCMHCHMVRVAERVAFRAGNKPLDEGLLWPYPLPDAVGLVLDSREKATIKEVGPNSLAARAGFKARDQILRLEGQPIVSIADVQWVLQHAKDNKSLRAEVQRGDKVVSLTLNLTPSWRRNSEYSWRTSTWDLRRIALGGLKLQEAARAGVPRELLELRVEHVGQYGDHAVAKKAGFERNDVIVSFDGLDRHASEYDLITHVLMKRKPGDKMDVTVLRKDRRVQLVLPVQ